MGRFRNLFKLHRFDFSYGVATRKTTTGSAANNVHTGRLRAEFEQALSELAMSGQSGDTLTFTVVKRGS
jgi:hypothetical protein